MSLNATDEERELLMRVETNLELLCKELPYRGYIGDYGGEYHRAHSGLRGILLGGPWDLVTTYNWP